MFLDCLVSNFGSLEKLRTSPACAPAAAVRVAICGHTQEYSCSSCYLNQGFFTKNSWKWHKGNSEQRNWVESDSQLIASNILKTETMVIVVISW